jgi:hypothetical protein
LNSHHFSEFIGQTCGPTLSKKQFLRRRNKESGALDEIKLEIIGQGQSPRNLMATCFMQHCVMLPAELLRYLSEKRNFKPFPGISEI